MNKQFKMSYFDSIEDSSLNVKSLLTNSSVLKRRREIEKEDTVRDIADFDGYGRDSFSI